MENTILEMTDISKEFPGVKALDKVRFDLRPGEIHALAGENGAGKSTFMKILTGIYKLDAGEIKYKGKTFVAHGPKHAQECGISIIHQELNLLPDLSVANNIYIGREPRVLPGIINDAKMIKDAQQILDQLGIDIDARDTVKNLSIASQQMVEIAKALSVKSEVLVLDEPTSSISLAETKILFEILKKLKRENVGIIYISHRLEEFDEIVDRVTVLRDGQYVCTKNWADYSIPELISDMVGRKMEDEYPQRHSAIGDVRLEVKNLTRKVHTKTYFEDVSFDVRAGEVLGMAGLIGAGRTETVRAIVGADKLTSGEVYLDGKQIHIKAPSNAIAHGIAYLPEDRKHTGLFLDQSVGFNILAASLDEHSKIGFVLDKEGEKTISDKISKLKIKTPSKDQIIRYLSGGNQQKVLVGKWLCKDLDVVIFDEPTRGIDVGAKYEVFTLINEIAESGSAVIVISSEMNEVLGISDRIVVMSEGKVTGIVDAKDATQEQIMELASKINTNYVM